LSVRGSIPSIASLSIERAAAASASKAKPSSKGESSVTVVSDRWAVGAAYEAYLGRWSRALANHFVDWLGVEARAHWLDVGCGTGALTAAICELGRPQSVVACDPSGPFIETASSTLPDKRVSFELAGGEHLPEREGGFDIVVSGLVLNFVPDPLRALLAMRRRLGARGIVAAYVWDYSGGVQFLQHFWRAAVELDASAQELDEARRFASFGPEALAPHFRGAGLDEVAVDALSLPTVFASFDDYWEPFLGRTGPAPSYVASLSSDRRDRLREALRERLTPGADGRISLEARAWAARGASSNAVG
jgi:SAM-dependent methyltransferase